MCRGKELYYEGMKARKKDRWLEARAVEMRNRHQVQDGIFDKFL